MINFTYKISDAMGLHARPAGMMVKILSKHKEIVKLIFNSKEVDGKRLYQVMSLGAKFGDEITITVEGENESLVKDEILQLFKSEKL